MTTDEVRLPGDPPRWQVPGWREELGVVAGITGRRAADGDFDLGLWTASPVGEVMTRWRRFRDALPEFPAQVMAHQVHGNRVLWADTPGPGSGWTIHDGADGHATDRAGVLLLVTVADCVPVYLVAPARRAVALLHAGWRGTAAGILEQGVALLRERTGAEPAELRMHAGVAISGPCYQVGAEVMTGVGRPAVGSGPWWLDIREVLAERAGALGIGAVSVSGHCTSRENDEFFSHRASGGRDGRMVAYLGIPAERPLTTPSPDG